MMREIKFRAILKGESVFREVYGIDFLELKVLVSISGSNEWHSWKVLVQYTGLKDKNGTEIYEDDVVSIDGGAEPVNCKVGFEHGCYVTEAPWVQKGWSYPELKHYTDIPDAFAAVEVIGNIHENGDLLNGDH